MVANKNSDTEGTTVASAVKVGSDSQKTGGFRSYIKHPTKKRAAVGLLFILVVIVIVVGIVQVVKPGQKVYAQVDGHKIYKSDVDNIKQGYSYITDKQAATVLADKYLSEAMARQYRVTVSQADINAANVAQTPKSNRYGYQNLVNQVYFTELNINNQGAYKGKLLVANFSRNVPFQSALLPQQKAANPNIGNAIAIAADKKYAQDFITNLYNQIMAKKITFDQAIQMEHDDPVVGENGYPSLSHSGAFDGTLRQISPLAANSIQSKMRSIKPGQLTPPFVVRAADSTYNPKSTAESYFLVVQLDSKSGGGSGMTFQQELDQAKKQLGYKIYV